MYMQMNCSTNELAIVDLTYQLELILCVDLNVCRIYSASNSKKINCPICIINMLMDIHDVKKLIPEYSKTNQCFTYTKEKET